MGGIQGWWCTVPVVPEGAHQSSHFLLNAVARGGPAALIPATPQHPSPLLSPRSHQVLGALAAQVAAEEESAAPLASAGECVSSTHLCDSSICSPVGDTLSAVLGDTLLGLVLTIAATLPSLHVHIAAGTHTADLSCFVEVCVCGGRGRKRQSAGVPLPGRWC